MAACGGDEDSVPSEILPAAKYENRCEVPRTDKDALGRRVFPDEDGSLLSEQLWLRSWIDDTYLWYREVPRADPKMFDTALAYFEILKSGVQTSSGKPKDQFHFTYTTEEWISLSQSGVQASYGVSWSLISRSPPRMIVAAYVQPGSPAALEGITRGTLAITVDGVSVADGADVATLNDGLFPNAPDVTHTLVVLDRGATEMRTVTVKSASLASTPVSSKVLPAPHDKVGYILFNDHIQTAEKGLVEAITSLKAAGITDLVLDLRYNGGGYLAIAAELAYMIAGPSTAGVTFEKLQFNDKHPTRDPVTGQLLEPQGFLSEAQGFSVPAGTPLPHLDLPVKRVFVLTGPGTCSASEAVMNGLAGADVQVIQMGQTTCGKPYGFYPTDNCGTTYFAIQFEGVNAKGFGDFADGFTPGRQNSAGCIIPDDFTHELGDPAEARVAAALAYMAAPGCPVAARARSADPLAAVDGEIPKPLWLQNAIMTR
jgi:C-terminal processing protease CtpA/Prc